MPAIVCRIGPEARSKADLPEVREVHIKSGVKQLRIFSTMLNKWPPEQHVVLRPLFGAISMRALLSIIVLPKLKVHTRLQPFNPRRPSRPALHPRLHMSPWGLPTGWIETVSMSKPRRPRTDRLTSAPSVWWTVDTLAHARTPLAP